MEDIAWKYYPFVAAGTFWLYFASLTEGKPIIAFLCHINGDWTNATWARIADAAIFTALGALLAIGIVNPGTIPQAIASGLGLTGLIASFRQL